jgi:hypothetical protein
MKNSSTKTESIKLKSVSQIFTEGASHEGKKVFSPTASTSCWPPVNTRTKTITSKIQKELNRINEGKQGIVKGVTKPREGIVLAAKSG